jgi:hypothetical protein
MGRHRKTVQPHRGQAKWTGPGPPSLYPNRCHLWNLATSPVPARTLILEKQLGHTLGKLSGLSMEQADSAHISNEVARKGRVRPYRQPWTQKGFQYPSTRDAIGHSGTIESRERAQDRREAFAQRLWTTGALTGATAQKPRFHAVTI